MSLTKSVVLRILSITALGISATAGSQVPPVHSVLASESSKTDIPVVVYVQRSANSVWESYATGSLSIDRKGSKSYFSVAVQGHAVNWWSEVQADGSISSQGPDSLLPVLLPLEWKRAARPPTKEPFTCAPGIQATDTAENGELHESCNGLSLRVLRLGTAPPN
jgi:hypothetical protein